MMDTPDRWYVVGMRECALYLSLGQEHVEVSVLHVLRHHAERVGAHAHAQQLNDVWVIQTRHDLYLLQEVISAQMQKSERLSWDQEKGYRSTSISKF